MRFIDIKQERPIPLGRKGENQVTTIRFFKRALFPFLTSGAQYLLVHQRKDDAAPYPCVLTEDGECLLWVVASADVDHIGNGVAQLTAIVDDAVAKSSIFTTITTNSLGETTDPPAAYQAWVDQVGGMADRAENAAENAEAAQSAIENMTVSSETLEPDSEVTVEKTVVGGVVNLEFGIPRGATGAVVSVAGKTGVVTLVKSDVGLGNVDNTSDATKKTNFTGSIADGNTGFVTGDAAYDALALKLNLSGGTMSGAIEMGDNNITGLGTPTADADAATKKYADDLVSGLGAVFKFKGTKTATSELPTSGNNQGDVWLVSADDSEYVWTSSSASGSASDWEKLGVTVDLSGYATLASPAFTGTPTAPTAASGTNTTQIATTAFVKSAIDGIAERLNNMESDISAAYKKPASGIPASDLAAPASPAPGQYLSWNGSAWVAASLPVYNGGVS